jgi:hypothetical protein
MVSLLAVLSPILETVAPATPSLTRKTNLAFRFSVQCNKTISATLVKSMDCKLWGISSALYQGDSCMRQNQNVSMKGENS